MKNKIKLELTIEQTATLFIVLSSSIQVMKQHKGLKGKKYHENLSEVEKLQELVANTIRNLNK